MFLSLQTLGKAVHAVNVLLTGGVIVAGGALFVAGSSPTDSASGFERRRPVRAKAAPEKTTSILDDLGGEITVDKFLSLPAPAPAPAPSPKPAAPAAVPAPAPAPPADIPFKVKGIMLSTRKEFTAAIVEMKSSREQRTVFAGETVDGVEILRVQTDCIVVYRAGEEVEVPLDITDEGGEKKAKKKPARGSGGSTRPNRDWRKNVPRPAAGAGPRAAERRRRMKERREAGGKAAARPGSQPNPKDLAKLPRSEIIKKLPPKLQEWWAKLPPEEKDRWERRFRKKYGGK